MQSASDDPQDDQVVWTCCKNNDGELGIRSVWARKNGLFTPIQNFDWESFDNPNPEKRTITLNDLETVFESGAVSSVKARAVQRLDERLFLKTVITQTMKEFSDWRRKQLGCNHSLGWVVGTHVEANGADRHPHIHLVVLKRDEIGKEVDWSVSSLKGRVEKTDPDPMKELKRVFGKNVEKHLERMLGKENDLSRVPTRLPVISQKKKDLVHRFLPNLYRVRFLGRSLRAVFYVMQSHQRFTPDMITQNRNHIGAILRFVALARRNTEIKHSREVSLPEITISDIQQKIRQLFHRQKEKSLDMELEP